MPARDTEAAVEATSPDAAVAAPASGAALAAPSLSPSGLLALQRTVGNAAVGRLLQRRVTMTTEGEGPAPPITGIASWSEAEVRTIQRELARLNLYNLSVDGDPGARTEVSLSEAFGDDRWRTMSATEVTEALRAAEKPWGGKGRTLRYAELFRDGVLDVTFGVGYFEGKDDAAETREVANAVMEAIEKRGYKEDAKKAAELLAAAGRPLARRHHRPLLRQGEGVHVRAPGGPEPRDPLDRPRGLQRRRGRWREDGGGVPRGHGRG